MTCENYFLEDRTNLCDGSPGRREGVRRCAFAERVHVEAASATRETVAIRKRGLLLFKKFCVIPIHYLVKYIYYINMFKNKVHHLLLNETAELSNR